MNRHLPKLLMMLIARIILNAGATRQGRRSGGTATGYRRAPIKYLPMRSLVSPHSEKFLSGVATAHGIVPL